MDAHDSTRDSGQEPNGESTDYLADHTGARAKAVGSTPATAAVEVAPERAEADLDVAAYYLDGEPSLVEVVLVGVAGADVRLSMPPADARDFAEQVAEAARFSTEGE